MTSRYIKNFQAGTAMIDKRLVAYTATDDIMNMATGAANEVIAGVVDCPGGCAIGERFDVVLFGPSSVECGGTITPGASITSDANGKAIAAAPGAGVNMFVSGRLLVNAVSGDIAKSFVNPHRIQG